MPVFLFAGSTTGIEPEGKGENVSFHLLRKAHENPKVFVGAIRPGRRATGAYSRCLYK